VSGMMKQPIDLKNIDRETQILYAGLVTFGSQTAYDLTGIKLSDNEAFGRLFTGADLRKAYETLKKVHETKFIAGDNLKKSENTLKEEMAKHKNFYKKDGTTLDLAKVKMKLVKSAIEVNATGADKIQQELDLQKEYQVDLKNISKGMVESFIGKKTAFDEVSNEIKDVKENLKTTMDTDIVEAIESELIKRKFIKYIQNK
jgi:hypothetical protein